MRLGCSITDFACPEVQSVHSPRLPQLCYKSYVMHDYVDNKTCPNW